MSEKGGGTFNISVDLNEGWNFFSLPGYIPNTGGSIAQILSSITGKYEQVSTYDTAADKWLHYVGDARFDQFDKFEYGRGYLIYCNEGCSISLSGNYPLNGVQYSLKEGWNLVAAPTDSQIETSLALRGVTYDSVAGYNGADYAYGPAALEKGKAYWVHVANSQTWSVPLPRIETVYSYDGDGGRVMRKIGTVPQGGVSSGGDCPNFSTHYIGSSYEVEGDKTTKHIFMGSTRVCSIEDLVGVTGQSNHSYEVYYYHQDHIGSSNVITDGTGAIVQILEYSPFGEVSRSTGNYSTDKRFTGKIYDDSSALLYFGARYYDPELGRFITADPTIAHPFDPQDLNRYSYCRNNPVNYIDPTGLSWWSSFWNWLTSGVGAIIASIAIIAVTAVAAIFTGGALAPVLWGEISGAIAGAAGAAATGGDIGRGMLIGTIVGGITGGVMGQMSAAAGAEGGASGGAAAGGTTAGLIIPADIALSMGTSMASTSAAVAVSNAGISAWGSVLASGVVGGGAAVINGMVSNAYAAGSKVGNHVTGEGPRLSIGFSGIRVAGKYTYVTHAGLQITGTDDYNISAGFNPENSNDISMFLGKPVNGVVRPNERYAFTLTVSKDPVFIQRVFNNIMKSSQNPPKYDFHALNDGKHYECYDWVADMLGS
ncbi:MAG: RHS repeat-associated core domain-containing protein [Candidatus Omnitrophota bacterium]